MAIKKGTRPHNPNNNGRRGEGDPLPLEPYSGEQPTDPMQWLVDLLNPDQKGKDLRDFSSILGSNSQNPNGDPFNVSAGDSFLDQLSQLQMRTDGMNNDQKVDWNKQLLDVLLSYLMQKENRQYNESMLKDQRSYDHPLNQLLRLMSTGMSRDAALQYISGGGASGSGVPFSDLMQLPNSAIAASESSRNGVESRVAIANAVFNGLQTVVSCCNMGVGMAQALQVVKGLQMQNFMSSENVNNYRNVSALAQQLQDLSNTSPDLATALQSASNANDVYKLLKSKSNDETFAPLLSSGLVDNVFGSPIGRNMFNEYWRSIRDSRDAGTLLDQYKRKMYLDNAATSLDMSKVSAEIGLIGSQQNVNEQKLIQSAYEIAKLNAETNQLNTLNSLALATFDSNVEFAQAQAQSASAQAGINQRLFELNEAGFPMLKQIQLDNLQDEMLQWSVITDPAQLEKRKEYWLNDRDNRQTIAYLNAIESNMNASFAENHPTLTYLCKTARYLFGKVDPVGDTSKVVGALGTVVKALK